MYATDAIVWLQEFDGHSSLERLGRLAVAPVLAPGSAFLPGPDEHSLSAFGFGADGAMANGTYVFAFVVLVLFAVVQRTTVPLCLSSSCRPSRCNKRGETALRVGWSRAW